MKILGFEIKKAERIPVSRNDIKTKVGEFREFYGNLVQIGWIDHAYVAIDFVRQNDKPRIALSCPEFFPQCNKWVDELDCLKPVTNRENRNWLLANKFIRPGDNV